MSIQLVDAVLDQKGLTISEKLILALLANHANAAGLDCFPKQATIAARLEISTEAVCRILKSLAQKGRIIAFRGPGNGSGRRLQYQVLSGPFSAPQEGGGNMITDQVEHDPESSSNMITDQVAIYESSEERSENHEAPGISDLRKSVAALQSEQKVSGPVIDIEPESVEVQRPPRRRPPPPPSGPPLSPLAVKEGFGPHELLDLWNSTKDPDLPKATMTPGREEQAKALLRVIPDRLVWAALIKRLNDSDFCRGLNKTGWKADFDFLIKDQTNIAKISEGKYDNREVPRDERKHFQEG